MSVPYRQTHDLPRTSRAGAVVTEFALSVPLILLFAIGVADFGRIAYFHQIICNAARTAAESGATHGFTTATTDSWENQVYAAALSEIENVPEFNMSEFGYIATTAIDSDGLAVINVTVSYPFRTSISWPGLPNEVMLSKTIQFRQFR